VAAVTAWLRALARRRRRRRRLTVAGMVPSRLTAVPSCRPIVSRRQIPTARASAAAPAPTRGSVTRDGLVATKPSLVADASEAIASTRPGAGATAEVGIGADSGAAASGRASSLTPRPAAGGAWAAVVGASAVASDLAAATSGVLGDTGSSAGWGPPAASADSVGSGSPAGRPLGEPARE
jgi:hypothetical protein